jgi:hypothetical protein
MTPCGSHDYPDFFLSSVSGVEASCHNYTDGPCIMSTRKGSVPIPILDEGGHTHRTIRVPSNRPAVADTSQYMHELSLDDSKGGNKRGSQTKLLEWYHFS